MPSINSSMPAPVMAEPTNTGCTRPAPSCASSAARARPSGTGPATYAPSSASSCRVSTSSMAASSPSRNTAGVSRAAISRSTRSGSAPVRSILFTKIRVGMPSLRRVRISTLVCACTPSTADTTSTAPSSTLSTRSTSAMKSGWPGVSMRLTVRPAMVKDTTADLMVMPRRRSSSSESVCVLPASTLPSSAMTPAVCSRRSVRLVLPASTWATIPRLRVVRIKRHVLARGMGCCLVGHDRWTHDHSPVLDDDD